MSCSMAALSVRQKAPIRKFSSTVSPWENVAAFGYLGNAAPNNGVCCQPVYPFPCKSDLTVSQGLKAGDCT